MIKDIPLLIPDLISEDITRFGCKTWRNQAGTEFSLEISFCSVRYVIEVAGKQWPKALISWVFIGMESCLRDT